MKMEKVLGNTQKMACFDAYQVRGCLHSFHENKDILKACKLLNHFSVYHMRGILSQKNFFFQSGAIVPLERIQQGRYTEASHAFLPIEKSTVKGIIELPAGQCVIAYHTGDYLSIGKAYERILEYCRSHHLKIISDSYEFAINDYLSTGNEAEYITKIMFYVE